MCGYESAQFFSGARGPGKQSGFDPPMSRGIMQNGLKQYIPRHLVLPSIGFLVLYRGVLFDLFKGWFNYGSSYGLPILLVSLYMIWSSRQKLQHAPVRPSLFAGSLITVLGCSIFFFGRYRTSFVLAIPFVLTLLGIICILWGYRWMKILSLPVMYLLVMFPVFGDALSSIRPFLQYTTASIATALLGLTGIPVYRSGYLIQLPHIGLEVAPGCSGINHIIALVAIAVPLAFQTQRNTLGKTGLIASAFLLGIFLNGLRVAMIGVWALYNPNGSLHGPLDTLYVSFIFFFGVGLLFIINAIIRKLTGSTDSTIASESNGFHLQGLYRGVRSLPAQLINTNLFPVPGTEPAGKGILRTESVIAAIILISASGFVYLFTHVLRH